MGLREKGKPIRILGQEFALFTENLSILSMMPEHPVTRMLSGIRLYRIDPVGSKEPNPYDRDRSILDLQGHNLAAVLRALEKNDELREEILEWMQLILPGLEGVDTRRQKLDGRTVLTFREKGLRRAFPAHLVSDGTIYALSILVAVLDKRRPDGMILIEEPERGLHPKAIQELVRLMRERATLNRPIWVTTHNESLVRAAKRSELWLVDKVDGMTQVRRAPDYESDLPLDQAWLSNVLGGGLPW